MKADMVAYVDLKTMLVVETYEKYVDECELII